MLDFQAEIDSDLSVFHRVDDPMQLAGSRYFSLVELLPYYDGAVRGRIVAEAREQQAHEPAMPGIPAPSGPAMLESAELLAEMTHNDQGFPGIEYVKG